MKIITVIIKEKIKMNIVIIYVKIITKVEFKFIYRKKEKHISIAKCKAKLKNNSIINIYGYDNIADNMYKNLKQNEEILIHGKLDSKMDIQIIWYKAKNFHGHFIKYYENDHENLI